MLEDINIISKILCLFGYALASVAYLLIWNHESRKVGYIGVVLMTIATAAGTVALVSAPENLLGLKAGMLLSVILGWLAIFAQILRGLRVLSVFIAPLATLLLILQFLLTPSQAYFDQGSWLMQAHIGLAVVGEAFAICACGMAIFFLWQQKVLKKKLITQINQRLPGLESLHHWLMVSLQVGFCFLTFGLISGATYTQIYHTQTGSELDAKVIWAIIVWVWYLSILVGKSLFHLSRKRIAQMSLGGFALLAITFFGMIFIRSPEVL